MKMYVIVRRDLSPAQRAVQGGHALAEYLLEHGGNGWKNGTLIYLGVKNIIALSRCVNKMVADGIKFSIFTEPDMNNEITAAAAVGDDGCFNHLNLME